MVGESHVPYNSINKGLSVYSDTTLDEFEPSLSCSSQNTHLLVNCCGSQLQSQPSGQNVTIRLHSDLDVFQKYFDLCAGNARPRYSASLKDVKRSTSDFVKCKLKPNADSDVFETYSYLCVRNVRPWCLSNLSQATGEAIRANSHVYNEPINSAILLTEDPNCVGPSVSNQCERRRQNNQVRTPAGEVANFQKLVVLRVLQIRSMCTEPINSSFLHAEVRRPPTVAHDSGEGCSSSHSGGSSPAYDDLGDRDQQNRHCEPCFGMGNA
ncbi:hypothetical protein Tco_0867895 [Tanacetum coccineum]